MINNPPKSTDFWEKISKGFTVMGRKMAVLAISLWLVMTDSETPKGIKITIASALVYLIMPIDMIPDFIPITGYTDDLAALTAAATAAGSYMTKKHKKRAHNMWAGL